MKRFSRSFYGIAQSFCGKTLCDLDRKTDRLSLRDPYFPSQDLPGLNIEKVSYVGYRYHTTFGKSVAFPGSDTDSPMGNFGMKRSTPS